MTPIPQPSASTTTTYTHLLSILHSSTPFPLEIDILPSSHPPKIHHTLAPPSLGLPKTLLLPLYLHAHTLFFSYLHPHRSIRNNDSSQPREEEAYSATSVMLLWDPNHITAVNFRKRHLLALKAHTMGFEDAVEQEMYFLTSLLTSPLVKHTKSSTLWAHRLWVLRRAPEGVVRRLGWESGAEKGSSESGERAGGLEDRGVQRFWDEELGVVMKAGERHPRNYYAWDYARDLLRELAGWQGQGGGDGRRKGLARGGLGEVHRWCLQHPRDVSGWAFLEFLLREICGEGEGQMGGGEVEVTRVVWETREFVRKYEWRGGSIEWFLKSVQRVE